MGRGAKTDNQFLSLKLFLRRYFLQKYHSTGPLHVFDACQGEGIIWKKLKSEFDLKSYWGVDRKPRSSGQIRIDSVKILAQPNWRFNIVDIDVYGSPWKHWSALLPNVSQPTTVFLTIGHMRKGGSSTDHFSLASMGLTFPSLQIPSSLGVKVVIAYGLPYCLALADRYKLTIKETSEAFPPPRTLRYIGMHLRPSS